MRWRITGRVNNSIQLYTSWDQKLPKMAPTRYFPNITEDHNEKNPVNVTRDKVVRHIKTIIHNIEVNFKPTRKNGEDGLYLGTAGIAYMYYHLSQSPQLTSDKVRYLTMALEYLKPAILPQNLSTKKSEIPSFILGNSGVYAIAAVLFKEIGDAGQHNRFKNSFLEGAEICKESSFLTCGSDELFVGRAGYILGSLWLAKQTNTKLKLDDLHDICEAIVESGRRYKQRTQCECPLMYSYYNVEYLGAAHGLCSILQALISVPHYLDKNPSEAADIKGSIDYILQLQDDEGNFPASLDEVGQPNVLIHWCHGAGGMIFLMAKAYLIWGDQKYLSSCEKMAEVIWKKGLLKKGPGICHGVAGNGYCFLLMYRLTKIDKYIHQANYFAEFMNTETFKNGARTPDCPYSLYEGTAGTACFYADLLNPDQAAFPISDVFENYVKYVQ